MEKIGNKDFYNQIFIKFLSWAHISWKKVKKEPGFENLVQIYFAHTIQDEIDRIDGKKWKLFISQSLKTCIEKLENPSVITKEQRNVLRPNKDSKKFIQPDFTFGEVNGQQKIKNLQNIEIIEIKGYGTGKWSFVYPDICRLLKIKDSFSNEKFKWRCAIILFEVKKQSNMQEDIDIKEICKHLSECNKSPKGKLYLYNQDIEKPRDIDDKRFKLHKSEILSFDNGEDAFRIHLWEIL